MRRSRASASASGSRGSTSKPLTFRCTTRLYPWMSLATTAQPAAIASSSTMPNDSCPVDGATKIDAVL